MVVRSVALVSVLALAAPVMLEARDQWGQNGTQQAYNEGYNRGVRSGEEDARRRESYNYTDESDYRRADAGYRREYGNTDWYRNEFRRAFEQGYRTGYERYGYSGRDGYDRRTGPPPWSNGRGNGNNPYDRYGNYGDNRYNLATQTGFNDGYERGLDDGRDRRRNDPFAESRYRDGDHGYDRRYGSRDAYKITYRDAFRQGYERGYSDGRRNGNGNRPWWLPF